MRLRRRSHIDNKKLQSMWRDRAKHEAALVREMQGSPEALAWKKEADRVIDLVKSTVEDGKKAVRTLKDNKVHIDTITAWINSDLKKRYYNRGMQLSLV